MWHGDLQHLCQYIGTCAAALNKMEQPKRTPTRDIFIGNSGVSGENDGPLFYSSFVNIFKVKVVLIGDLGVGKTSIATRFVKGTFTPQYITTVGENCETGLFKVRDGRYS
ncbi:hypothetical protein CHS0354_021077 [Potamilus streckersoni]|uniref:Uncharacterized protein n=1 Tax=Potamilus streckersoni TaxID=2493646 RepID=A0AAE0SD93_9BIVA|nr:hypothetical protein CHS0354_021077 [Potamilus streckersoni]